MLTWAKQTSVLSFNVESRQSSPSINRVTRAMSRRRGVVHSDDEGEPSSRNSHRPVPRPSRPSEAIPELPNVAKLSAEDLQRIRLIDGENRALKEKINNAFNTVGDAAVAVEELKLSNHRAEVPYSMAQLIVDG